MRLSLRIRRRVAIVGLIVRIRLPALPADYTVADDVGAARDGLAASDANKRVNLAVSHGNRPQAEMPKKIPMNKHSRKSLGKTGPVFPDRTWPTPATRNNVTDARAHPPMKCLTSSSSRRGWLVSWSISVRVRSRYSLTAKTHRVTECSAINNPLGRAQKSLYHQQLNRVVIVRLRYQNRLSFRPYNRNTQN